MIMDFWIIYGVIIIICLSIVGYMIYQKANESELTPTGYVIGSITITLVLVILTFMVAATHTHDIDNFFFGLGFGINEGRKVTALLGVAISSILGLRISYLIVSSSNKK
jgi:hypothetical protein